MPFKTSLRLGLTLHAITLMPRCYASAGPAEQAARSLRLFSATARTAVRRSQTHRHANDRRRRMRTHSHSRRGRSLPQRTHRIGNAAARKCKLCFKHTAHITL